MAVARSRDSRPQDPALQPLLPACAAGEPRRSGDGVGNRDRCRRPDVLLARAQPRRTRAAHHRACADPRDRAGAGAIPRHECPRGRAPGLRVSPGEYPHGVCPPRQPRDRSAGRARCRCQEPRADRPGGLAAPAASEPRHGRARSRPRPLAPHPRLLVSPGAAALRVCRPSRAAADPRDGWTNCAAAVRW